MVSQAIVNFSAIYRAFPASHRGEPVAVSTEELSKVLFCSQRNVKTIVTKLVDLGWIEFTSGRGRGHRSTLILCKTVEEVVFDEASSLLATGDIQEAFELIKLHGSGTNARARLVTLLNKYFGYEVREDDARHIEILRFPIFRPINTLDPASVFFDFDANLVHQVFNRLVHYNEQSQTIEGQLAHFWQANASATRWVFHLRKGVLFHHGRELTANDVSYTLNRLQQSAHKWLVKNIEKIEIHDRYTIEIHLAAPNHIFLRYLAYTPMSIVPADLCEQRGQRFAQEPVGTGPFQCVKNTKTMCTLEVFQSYYAERAHLDRVEIIRVPDNVEFWRPTQPGQELIFVDHGESKTHLDEDWDDVHEVYAGSSVITVNLSKHGPQNDVKFREAFQRLLDRSKMIKELGAPRMYPAQGFLLVEAAPEVADPTHDLMKATSLLAESNYNGETLKLYTFARHAADALWIRDECSAYGIDIAVHVVDWSEILDPEIIQKSDAILFEAVVREGEVQQVELYQFENSFVRCHLNDELGGIIDQKIDAMVGQPNQNARRDILCSIEELLKDNYALTFLVHKRADTAYHPSVRGVRINSRVSLDFKDVWFQSAASRQATLE